MTGHDRQRPSIYNHCMYIIHTKLHIQCLCEQFLPFECRNGIIFSFSFYLICEKVHGSWHFLIWKQTVHCCVLVLFYNRRLSLYFQKEKKTFSTSPNRMTCFDVLRIFVTNIVKSSERHSLIFFTRFYFVSENVRSNRVLAVLLNSNWIHKEHIIHNDKPTDSVVLVRRSS